MINISVDDISVSVSRRNATRTCTLCGTELDYYDSGDAHTLEQCLRVLIERIAKLEAQMQSKMTIGE